MSQVKLVKHSCSGGGTLEVGTEYTWTYKTTPRAQVDRRAAVALKRDHPTEDHADWEVAADPVLKVARPLPRIVA